MPGILLLLLFFIVSTLIPIGFQDKCHFHVQFIIGKVYFPYTCIHENKNKLL